MATSLNQINRLHHANVYLEGLPMLGRCEEASLPEIKWMTDKHKALGLIAQNEYPTQMEGMKAKFKWSSLYPEVFALVADPTKMLRLQVYGSIQVYTGVQLTAEIPVVCFLRGWFNSQKTGDYKAGANVETESEMSVVYYKMVVDGATVLEVDTEANVYAVNGDDKLATLRANLGL
jgi:uncharacterized protein